MSDEQAKFDEESRRAQESWWRRWATAVDMGETDLARIAAERIAELEDESRRQRSRLFRKDQAQ